MKHTTEMRRYAEAIAEEIRALEQVLTGSEEEEWDAMRFLGIDPEVNDSADALRIYMNEVLLEVVTWRADEDRSRVNVEWLRTYGGPGCRIYFEGDDYATVRAYDMEGEAEVRVFAPYVAATVFEYAAQ